MIRQRVVKVPGSVAFGVHYGLALAKTHVFKKHILYMIALSTREVRPVTYVEEHSCMDHSIPDEAMRFERDGRNRISRWPFSLVVGHQS
jgi:hypothetical protein